MAVSLTKLVTVTSPETSPVTEPTKPLVEVTGPEKVVEAMVVPLAQGFAAQSVHRQVGRPVCVADVTLRELYIMGQKVPMNFCREVWWRRRVNKGQ
jgi:hypothetical protein